MVSPTQLCWRYHSLPLRQLSILQSDSDLWFSFDQMTHIISKDQIMCHRLQSLLHPYPSTMKMQPESGLGFSQNHWEISFCQYQRTKVLAVMYSHVYTVTWLLQRKKDYWVFYWYAIAMLQWYWRLKSAAQKLTGSCKLALHVHGTIITQCPWWQPRSNGLVVYPGLDLHFWYYLLGVRPAWTSIFLHFHLSWMVVFDFSSSPIANAMKIPLGYEILKSCSPHDNWNFLVFSTSYLDKILSGYRSSNS